MSNNGEREMLETLMRVFEDKEPLPAAVSNRLLLGGLKMVYAAARDARERSRSNWIQIRIQWAAISLLGMALGLKFIGLF